MSLDPTVLDAGAINKSGEFQMMLFDQEEWENPQEHQQQLQAKVAAYIEAAQAMPQAKDRKVRITLVSMYEPDESGRQLISTLRSVVESAGIAFEYVFRPVPEW